MIVMKEAATQAEIDAVVKRVESVGAQAHISAGEFVTVIGAIGDREHVATSGSTGAPGSTTWCRSSSRTSSRRSSTSASERTVLEIDGRKIGGEHFAHDRRAVHGRVARGAARHRPRPSRTRAPSCCAAAPTSRARRRTRSRASARRACACCAEAKAETGLPIVTELMDVRDLEPVLEVADVIQLGARNMQNYTLLTEVGRAGEPVLLKRGLSATLEELLMAAEYILEEGNEDVMLCERGIRTFETELPLHARPDGGAGAARAHAPADRDRPEPRGRAAPTWCSRCRWRPPRPAPTASSSRCTRAPRRRSATARRRSSPRTSRTTCASSRRAARAGRQAVFDGVKLAVLGVGLIGGSIGLAARERVEGAEVVRLRPRSRAARPAQERGAIDRAATSIEDAVEDAQLSSPARPSARCRSWCAAALDASGDGHARHGRGLHEARPRAPHDDPRFVGGHPIAGAETRRRGARARRPVPGRGLVPDAARALGGLLYERLHRLRRGVRRAAGGGRRRDARPARGRRSATCRTCSPTCSPSQAAARLCRPGRARCATWARASAT